MDPGKEPIAIRRCIWLIGRLFHIAPEAYVNTGFHRPNLTLRLTPTSGAERDAVLEKRLRERPAGATIVYVTLQRTAERVAERLAARGFPARAYHAGMDPEKRNAVQDWFMASGDAVVVATIAFGMGIDKADIRYVYHYNLPKGLENYAQEIGRAGRDGQPSTCEVLVCPDDVVTLENFTYGDTPTPEAVRALVHDVLGRGPNFSVAKYRLSRRHDIRVLVVATLLTYLELAGVIRATAPFYDSYRYQTHAPEDDIADGFNAQRAAFLRNVFAQARRGPKWSALDLDAAASALGESRQRIIAAFNYLEERGKLTLKVEGWRQGYRRVQLPADVDALAGELANRFQAAETREIGRLNGVLALARHESCVTRELLRYFGEELGGGCGHCDRCLGDPIRPLPLARVPQLGQEDEERLATLLGEGHEALATPRQIARFLCGLASPATSATRPPLTRHPDFGRFTDVPFATVMAFAERVMPATA